jgi:hypothetical protein
MSMNIGVGVGIDVGFGSCKYVHVPTVEKKRNAHAKAASPDHRSALFFSFCS